MLMMSRICAFVAIALLAVAGYLHVSHVEEPPFGQALTVHEPDRDLGTLPIGEHELRFRITNASSQDLRVIGASET